MKEIFANANVGMIGLLFFFTFFCLVALWTFRPGARKKYEEDSRIPFQERNDD